MTDHALVEWTLDTIATNYNPSNTSTTAPVLKDAGDGSVYEIDSGFGLSSATQRRYEPDPHDTNIVTVSASPDRQEEPIGTGYDLRVADAVDVLVEGVHEDEPGEIGSPTEFRSLYREVRRALLVERTAFPTIAGQTYHSIVPLNAGRPPADQQTNYFAWGSDFEFRAYEELP